LSPFAHNGFLQVLSDGGLVLGAPFLLACAGITWILVAELARAIRRRDLSMSSCVVPICLGALLVHSAVDFDWSYAADFAVAAVLAGLVLGTRWSTTLVRNTRTPRRLTAAAVVVGVVLSGIAAGAAWSGDMTIRLPIAHSSGR
jgi:O-antigen ligase